MESASPQATNPRYWVVVVALIAVGALTIFSLGLYFWFAAVALILLSPFRSRPSVFIPGLALFIGFLFGYVLVAPWSCGQSMTSNPDSGQEVASPVVCTSPTGVRYSGSAPFEPDRTPALLAAIATGGVAAAAAWAVVRSRHVKTPTPAGA